MQDGALQSLMDWIDVLTLHDTSNKKLQPTGISPTTKQSTHSYATL